MYQLVYASQYHNLSVLEVVEGIVEKAKRNNLKNKLTGVFVLGSGYFLQCLEGGRTAINKTFNRISRDSRHFNVTILTYKKSLERTFPFWTMAFASENLTDKEIYFKYHLNEFNPFKLDPEAALPFLKELGFVYCDKQLHSPSIIRVV